MKWELLLAGPARKALRRMPAADQRRILAALDDMEQEPFSGDIVHLKAQPTAWRRRVGDCVQNVLEAACVSMMSRRFPTT